jgi:hypothetical protein
MPSTSTKDIVSIQPKGSEGVISKASPEYTSPILSILSRHMLEDSAKRNKPKS